MGSLPGEVGHDVAGEVAELLTHRGGSAPVTVAAAAAAAAAGSGGVEPARARTHVFHTHRMFNYRLRFLHILRTMGAFEHQAAAGDVPAADGDALAATHALSTQVGAVLAKERAVVPQVQAQRAWVHVRPFAIQEPSTKRGRGRQGSALAQANDAAVAPPPQLKPVRSANQRAAQQCQVLAQLRGSGLEYVSAVAMLLPEYDVRAAGELTPWRADGAANTANTVEPEGELTVSAHMPAAVLQVAGLRAAAAVQLELSTDFCVVQVSAQLRFVQCAIVGSDAEAASHGDGRASERASSVSAVTASHGARPHLAAQRGDGKACACNPCAANMW